MLVRIPDKRATLAEIANHPWVNAGKQDTSDLLPLISREHLAEEDHNLIVQKIVNGNIATKEEIQEQVFSYITILLIRDSFVLVLKTHIRGATRKYCD